MAAAETTTFVTLDEDEHGERPEFIIQRTWYDNGDVHRKFFRSGITQEDHDRLVAEGWVD